MQDRDLTLVTAIIAKLFEVKLEEERNFSVLIETYGTLSCPSERDTKILF